MLDRLEKLIKVIYKERKAAKALAAGVHPDEESLACFLEGKLSVTEKDDIRRHLLGCDRCAEYISTQLKIRPHLSLNVPAPSLDKVKKLLNLQSAETLLEIFLKLKDKAMEIIQTTGDVLVGQELVPAPVLRSRQINEFKEEISILKDFQFLRVLAKIQNKNAKSFNLTITVKDKQSRKVSASLRVTLIKDGIELESYTTDTGDCFFENILPGNYVVEVIRDGQKQAIIGLKVKV